MTAQFDSGCLGFSTIVRAVRLVQIHDAVPLGILDVIGEDGRPGPAFARPAQQAGQAGAEEDIVAEHERDIVVADEIAADDEGLREAFRPGLHSVGEANARTARPSPNSLR